MASIFCLCIFLGNLYILFQKNEFPDIEDV
jgi:hypothetical protein